MAWPIDARFQTFVANVTTITAGFMNEIQDKVYGLIGGSRTVRKLSIDGTGDQANGLGNGTLYVSGDITTDGDVTLASGNVGVTGNVDATDYVLSRASYTKSDTAKSAAATPTASVGIGEVWKDGAVRAWCRFDIVGGPAIGFVRGYNITSVTYNALGAYTVVLTTGVTNTLCPVVVALDAAASILTIDTAAAPNATTFKILAFDLAGAPQDVGGVYLVVFGG